MPQTRPVGSQTLVPSSVGAHAGGAEVVQRAAGGHDERLAQRPAQRLRRLGDLDLRRGDRRLVGGAQGVVDPDRRQAVLVGRVVVEPDAVVGRQLLLAEPAEADDLPGPDGDARVQRHRRGVHLHDLAVERAVGGVGHPGDAGDRDDRPAPGRRWPP